MASRSEGAAAAGPPVVKPVVQRPSTNSILVNRRQEANPLLESLRNVAWEYAAISADFQVGATTCMLYLSLRYHRLHPEYIHRRITDLGKSYNLRIVLFQIDAKDPENEIKELTKVCLINNLTIMCAWGTEEAAQYIMTYKAYENKPPNMIKERIDQDYNSILRNALTSIKGVNKTDVVTMRTTFGDFASMSHATLEQLQQCPGFGKVKARRVKDAFEKPFFPGRKANALGAPSSTQPLPGASAKGKEKAPGQGDGLSALSKKDAVLRESESEPARAQEPRYSPDWDIDLDLNPSDEDDPLERTPSESPQPPSTKKRRPNPMDEFED